MKFTNKHNLPDTILRAARAMNDLYDRGPVKRSVTQLLQPPRIDMLRKLHFDEMEKDVSEEWWALFGNAVHMILEMGRTSSMILEERLFATIDGWDVSGKPDVQEYFPNGHVAISDYKITTAFVVQKDEDGVKPEWEQQLNMLAYLLYLNKGVTASSLQIVAVVRDWQRAQAQADPSYPIAPVVPLNMPVWSLRKQRAYIESRIRLHRNAEMQTDLGLEMPECSEEERWQRENSWAIAKPGAKRANKVYYDEDQAKAYLKELHTDGKKGHIDYEITFRPGKSVRCAGNYCQVAQWCEQWKRIKAEQGDENEEETKPEQD